MFTSTTTSDYSTSIAIRPLSTDRNPSKWKYTTAAAAEFAPNCPRCASSNTKFCYYNNYSLSQPRYFCKACRRYWTKGGSLRNVPVGGGCRKSRRARAARQGAAPSSAGPARAGPEDANSGAYIDMAAVFAKYVSQKEENGEYSFSPGGSSGSSENVPASSNDSGQFDEISMLEYQEPLDLGDDRVRQWVPQLDMCQDVSGQDFLYHGDCSGFDEMEGGVLGDGLLWSEGTTLAPNFGLEQAMVQGQDFGPVSPDDELRICSNLVADNWGSFDLSAYEFYSTP